MGIRRTAYSSTRRTITRTRTVAQILRQRRLAVAVASAHGVCACVRVYTARAGGGVNWIARMTMAATRGSGAGGGRSEGRAQDRRPMAGI